MIYGLIERFDRKNCLKVWGKNLFVRNVFWGKLLFVRNVRFVMIFPDVIFLPDETFRSMSDSLFDHLPQRQHIANQMFHLHRVLQQK